MTFIDLLKEKNEDVYNRLCACRNTKDDIKCLVNIRWMWMISKGKDKKGFTKEDALVDILEWLDSNGQWEMTDLTNDEYEELIA